MQNLKSALYREYQGGILVYDSHSRTPGESTDFEGLPKTQMTPEKVTLLDGCELNDRLQYMKMPQYPSTKYIRTEYTLVYPTDSTLSFNSKFESGNLAQAIKISENEYNLFLEFDTETQGYTQWYYFSAKSYKSEHTVKFNILNLIKPHSLYTHGLKPLIFSTKSSRSWERGGFDISYQPNSIPNKQSTLSSPSTYFTLSFSYKFEKEADRVFFAHNYPYTYSRLQTYIQDLNKTSSFRPFLKITNLCKTLAGNDCPLVTITENIESQIKENSESSQKKQIIFVTSRVHPGESNSSYIVKGLIDFLLTSTKEAKVLRKKFIFQIVPMLNPDGVVYGNTRCSLLGVDLNRRWKNPNKILHPTIYYAKALLESLKKQAKIFLFCDIHGHSRKKGSFIYACKKSGRNIVEQKENIWIRMFPLVMAYKYPNFDYSLCTFRIEKFKESTARVVAFKEFGILNSYTLENSFLGLDSEYDQVKLQEIGYSLCNVIWFFRNTQKVEKGVTQIYNKIIGQLSENNGACVMDCIENVSPGVIGEVYEEKDFEDSDESKEVDEKIVELKKVENRITVKRKSNKVRSRIQLRSNYSSTLIPRVGSVSGEKTGKIPQLMRDKKGSFRRLKIMLK